MQRVVLATLALFLPALAPGCAGAPSPAASVPTRASALPTRTLATAPDRFATTGEVTLRYRDLGAGEPVVLVHGFSSRLERWAGVADSLARSHRVVAVDVRGFGGSTRPADPARYGPVMAEDLAGLLDHLGVRRAHLVGHSMGAVLAAHLARRHPDRVATLTLAAGPFFADSLAAARYFEPHIPALERGEGLRSFLRANYPGWSDSTLDATNREVMARNDARALAAVMRAFPRLTLAPLPGQRPVPTLLVVGGADPVAEMSRRLARWWPAARLVEVPGADHGTVLFTPVLLAEVRRMIGARGGS